MNQYSKITAARAEGFRNRLTEFAEEFQETPARLDVADRDDPAPGFATVAVGSHIGIMLSLIHPSMPIKPSSLSSQTLVSVEQMPVGQGAQTLAPVAEPVQLDSRESASGGLPEAPAAERVADATATPGSNGLLMWGDGSGYGATGIDGIPVDGGGNDDRLTGSTSNDILFGDGSGGGKMLGNAGGRGGGGSDTLEGGDGDDLIFGDGFSSASELGGYGGGGGGDATWYGEDGAGGIGAGDGQGRYPTSPAPSWLGPLNQNTQHQAEVLGQAEDNWLGGAGVRNGNLGEGLHTDGVTQSLNAPAAQQVARYGGRSVYDKVLWDLSEGSAGYGTGVKASDAAGLGNGGSNVDARLYAQTMVSGNDVLRGGRGSDWLMGGGGADLFVWAGQDFEGVRDYVVDLKQLEGDRIGIDTTQLTGWADGADLSRWVKVETGLTADSPFSGGQAPYSRITIDTTGQRRFSSDSQQILLRGDPLSGVTFQDVLQLVDGTQPLGPSEAVTFSAGLVHFDWRTDQGAARALDRGDVIRLAFDQSVALAAADLPLAFGAGASLASTSQDHAGRSAVWEVRLGSGAALATGSALTIPVVDGNGVRGSVNYTLKADDIAAAAIQPINAEDLFDGVRFWGVAPANARLQISWGGVAADVFASADGTWEYTYYQNESAYGRKAPDARGQDLPVSLSQYASNGQLVLLWTQSARLDTVSPELLSITTTGARSTLAPGETVMLEFHFSEVPAAGFSADAFDVSGGSLGPLSGTGATRTALFTAGRGEGTARVALSAHSVQDVAGNSNVNAAHLDLPIVNPSRTYAWAPATDAIHLRAGDSAPLDLRDPTMNLTDGYVIVSGLLPYMSLSHGQRSALDGSWRVSTSDLGQLTLFSTRDTPGGQAQLQLSYGGDVRGVWQTQFAASASLAVEAWKQPRAAQEVEDFNNFTRVENVWNLGLTGLDGTGVTVEAEGTRVVLGDHQFEEGNVLAGSATGTSPDHGTRVGQGIAGGWDRSFVGVAHGALITWGPLNTDIDNNSWSYAAEHMFSMGNAATMPSVYRREGLGQIVTFSATNKGPEANVSLMASTKNATQITIGSIDNGSGEVAGFSGNGEALHGVAPGWGGTSHSAPFVAGVTALMLQANPSLGFRDVQSILAYAGTYLPRANPYANTALNAATTLNGAGMHFAADTGFGVMDAYNAVTLATDWLRNGSAAQTVQGWEHRQSFSSTRLTLPKAAGETVRHAFYVSDDIRLESIEFDARYDDPAFASLVIKLISPDGTVSLIADGSTLEGRSRAESIIASTRRFWGESSRGEWTLEFSHLGPTSTAASITLNYVNFFGTANAVDNRYVYTDEVRTTYDHVATAAEKAQMSWLNDGGGARDALMGSALTEDLSVQLGRDGWLSVGDFPVLLSPRTHLEYVFGGSGDDVLSGDTNRKSTLVGNAGNDVLMAYGYGSSVEGGLADDWIWLGGDSVAIGGQGDDKFVFFRGESALNSLAAVKARVSDFDYQSDLLLSSDVGGHYRMAQFDPQGQITAWREVTHTGFDAQLDSQLALASQPRLLEAAQTAQGVRLLFDQEIQYKDWRLDDYTINGEAVTGSGATTRSLSLSTPGDTSYVDVVHIATGKIFNSLGAGLSAEWIYIGTARAERLDASSQTGSAILFANGGSDEMIGGAGEDWLVAGVAPDVRMTGGAGADTFVLSQLSGDAQICRISDFSFVDGDRLSIDQTLPEIGSMSMPDLLHLERRGDDAVLTLTGDGTPYGGQADMEVFLEGIYLAAATFTANQLFQNQVVLA